PTFLGRLQFLAGLLRSGCDGNRLAREKDVFHVERYRDGWPGPQAVQIADLRENASYMRQHGIRVLERCVTRSRIDRVTLAFLDRARRHARHGPIPALVLPASGPHDLHPWPA